ncbi:MAG: transporter substrate-binding domain-containing protein [Alphaproteobacteria bacterium]|nr:transporter substrate-binding domain-containing protein [Alphaproteobacteria bacterium]
MVLPLLCLALAGCKKADSEASEDPAYRRVMESGVIRCGFTSWKPFIYIDPKTNTKGGIIHDLMEEIAKRYHLNIEWTAEVGWGEVVTALNTHRFDVACAAYWANTNRGSQVYFTDPVFYSKSYIWVRGDDKRQFKSYDDLNNPEYRFSYNDGSAESKIINLRFPRTRKQTLPELTPLSDLYELVAAGKADFMVDEMASVADYLKDKPDAVKKALDQPLALYPVVLMMAGGENRLKQMLDTAIREIELDGTLDRILAKYQAGDFFDRNAYQRQ